MRSGTTLNDFMQWDNTLFDGITLPSDIDHGILVSSIMLRCGLQNPVYEHYEVFKSQVHIWFSAHEWNFTRLVRLIKEEYNPLWNKDGVETREIDHTRDEVESVLRDVSTTDSISRTEQVTETNTGNETTTENGTRTLQGTDTYTDTHQVKGFNATDWQDTDRTNHEGTKNETETTGNTTETDTTKNNLQNATETVGENTTTDDDTARTLNRGKTLETFTSKGNIGVTTSQAMFLEEVNLLDGFNLYDWIAKKFDDDLMLGVYTY